MTSEARTHTWCAWAACANRCFCWFPSAMLGLIRMSSSMASPISRIRMASRLSRIRIIPATQILARVFEYLPPFISQILDLICRMVLNFILIYFGWRDTENQQLFSNFRANFDVHFMEQKFVNVASIFILKNI